MVKSQQDEVALQGARQVTARWFFHGYFESEFNECLEGRSVQRKGIADVAVYLLKNEKYSKKCQEILSQFMNDPEKDVRNELNGILKDNFMLKNQENKAFIKTYIKSQAFADNPDQFIFSIKESAANLIPIADAIFAVCEVFSTSLREKTRDTSSRYPFLVPDISTILLRLYEQALGARNQHIVDLCLNIWDLLFEKRVGRTIELTKAIEQ